MKNGVHIFSLEGKSALITGATGHLGSAMATILAEAGAHVLVNSRSGDKAGALVNTLTDQGYSAEKAVFDVTSGDAVETFFAQRLKQPLDILINNAYIGGAGTIELSEEASYTASYDIAVVAAHRLVRNALPSMRKAVQISGEASVINICSMYAVVSPDQRVYDSASSANPPFYGAAKAALLQWTRYAACEYGKEGIRFNAISPGPFPSDAVQQENPSFIEALGQKVPMGRIGSPEELKGTTLFLASSASSFVNGANIVVDGGWTAW